MIEGFVFYVLNYLENKNFLHSSEQNNNKVPVNIERMLSLALISAAYYV